MSPKQYFAIFNNVAFSVEFFLPKCLIILLFSLNCPMLKMAQLAKIRPFWSPCLGIPTVRVLRNCECVDDALVDFCTLTLVAWVHEQCNFQDAVQCDHIGRNFAIWEKIVALHF
jgi:hypothetical protein